MRIYLAHPYTGDEVRNRERALRAEELLRKATPQTAFYNRVVFCGDWAQSRGCILEAQVAQRLSLPRWYGVGAYVKMWRCVEIEAQYEEVAL